MIVQVYIDDDVYEWENIPDYLEQDLINWLEWTEKLAKRNKKYEEAQSK